VSDTETRELLMMYAEISRSAALDPSAIHRATAKNDSCGDQVEVALRLDGEHIVGYSYSVSGCALSGASAALIDEMIPGLTREAVIDRVALLEAALQEPRGAPWPELLNPVVVLEPLRGNPYRRRCVMLAWRAVARALG
jgi:nitrogen fixation NifU-like protein